MSERWTAEQKEQALGIVNDIAEGIDNRESRSELRQALAIYADWLCEALQENAIKRSQSIVEECEKLLGMMELKEEKK